MPDKDLESFKIGDNRRAGVSNPISSKTAEPSLASSDSVGFARIEKILEDQSPEITEEKLQTLIANLESFGKNATSNKDKLAAQKAVGAVEKVADLMNYLFQTKESLQTNTP